MVTSVAQKRGRKEARGRDGAFPGLMGDLWPVETNHGRAHARFHGRCSAWVTWRMIMSTPYQSCMKACSDVMTCAISMYLVPLPSALPSIDDGQTEDLTRAHGPPSVALA